MVKLDLLNLLTKVWFKMDEAKNLVDDGKEVLCSRALQGALTNLRDIIDTLGDEIKKERETNTEIEIESD